MKVFNVPLGKILRYVVVLVIAANIWHVYHQHRSFPGPEHKQTDQQKDRIAINGSVSNDHNVAHQGHIGSISTAEASATVQRNHHVYRNIEIDTIIKYIPAAKYKYHRRGDPEAANPGQLLDINKYIDNKNIIDPGPSDNFTGQASATIINPHPFRYILNNASICANSSILAVVFVQSAANGGKQARDLIRSTWASVTDYNGHQIRTVFMLGRPTYRADQNALTMESEMYGDIVQQDFKDHYRNLTYKHIMALRWIAQYCHQAQHIIKADDDTAVNIFRLITGLAAGQLTFMNTIYCSIYGHMSPRRDKSDKWYVSWEEYPEEVYPPYCEGYAYILDPKLAPKLVEAALTTPYYWIDDVYVTGILMKKVGGKHRSFKPPYASTELRSGRIEVSSMHEVVFILCKYMRGKSKEDIWKVIWNDTLATRIWRQSHQVVTYLHTQKQGSYSGHVKSPLNFAMKAERKLHEYYHDIWWDVRKTW